MNVKDRVYVALIALFGAIILTEYAALDANKPKQPTTVLASVAKAQAPPAPKADPDKPGLDQLKKDAKAFKRGAKPTPRAKLFAAKKFVPTGIRALPQVAYVPKKLDMWGNDQYGDCVSAEEAANQAMCGVFIDPQIVIAWARKNGWLNGADLTEVMDAMQKSGFVQGGKTYGDGAYTAVDYTNETTLKAALSLSPVKLGMDASALPSGAGNQQGWYAFGGKPGQFNNEDHCTNLCGYGPASFCFQVVGAQLPAGVDPNKPCYLHYTWSTIGVVDHDWIMSTVGEAWSRNPDQTIDGQPQPNPGPTQSPPVISSPATASAVVGTSFSYQITATNSPTTYGAAGLPAGVTCAATTGAITGTPTAAGTFLVTLSATNAVGTGTEQLALTVTGGGPTPPNPPDPPVPSNVKVVLDPSQVLALQRDPTNTFNPTMAQVQDIINQSGLEVIDGKMTLAEFEAAKSRAINKKTPFKAPSKPTMTPDERMDRLEKSIMDLMDRLDKK